MRILILTFFAAVSWAQLPQPSPPSSNGLAGSTKKLDVRLPKALEFHLDNGVTVLLVEDHRLPEIYMLFLSRGAGSSYEPPAMPGLANATAAMLLRGTSTRTSLQIAREVDLLSTEIRSYAPGAGTETTFSLSGLSENFERWFRLGIDELLHPAFSPDEFDLWRQQQLANSRNRRGNPDFLAAERFTPVHFSPIPSATPGTPANLQAITTEAMKKWHDERYAPQNAILGILGDVTPGQLLPWLKSAFSSWKKNDFSVPEAPGATSPAESKVVLVHRPSAVQTTLLIGSIGPARRDPDYEIFQVLNRIFLINVRRNLAGQSYAYIGATTSSSTTGESGGSWQLQTAFRTEVTEQALREVFSEVRQIRGDAPRDESVAGGRLEEQKEYLVSAFAFSLEHPDQILEYCMDRKLYNLPAYYWDKYPSIISAVTREDLQRVARKYVDLKTLQIIAVGDAAKIRGSLEQYGKVTVYDTEGSILP